jgi:hypothetical protein
MKPKTHLNSLLRDGIFQRGKFEGLSLQDLSSHQLAGLHGVVTIDPESKQHLKAEMEMRKASGSPEGSPRDQNPSLCLTKAQHRQQG